MTVLGAVPDVRTGGLRCGRRGREDNPSAAFTGLIHQYRLHIEAKRYAEALRVGGLIEQRYPRNSSGETVGQYNRWLRKQLKEAGQ